MENFLRLLKFGGKVFEVWRRGFRGLEARFLRLSRCGGEVFEVWRRWGSGCGGMVVWFSRVGGQGLGGVGGLEGRYSGVVGL